MTSLVFEKLTQALGANETWRIGIAADFMRIETAQSAVTVRLLLGGRVLGEMANVQAGDYARVLFDEIQIVNGGTAQTVTIQIAGGGVGSDRVVGAVSVLGTVGIAGEVSVINGEAARVESDKAFIGFVTQGAAAGVYSIAQLYNPAGSGKACWLSKITLRTTSASDFNLYSHNAALAGLYGSGVSKRIRTAAQASAAQLRMQQNASPFGNMFMQIAVPNPSDSKDFPFQEPLKIEPGYSILVMPGSVNVPIYASFQWTEEVF